MNSDEKRQVFHDAVELIVDRIVSEANPNNAGAYAAKTRTALRSQYRDDAREIFDACDDLGTTIDATQLADLLAPPTPKPVQSGPCPSCGAVVPPPPSVPTYDAEPWQPASPEDRSRARQRLTEIRQKLGGAS